MNIERKSLLLDVAIRLHSSSTVLVTDADVRAEIQKAVRDAYPNFTALDYDDETWQTVTTIVTRVEECKYMLTCITRGCMTATTCDPKTQLVVTNKRAIVQHAPSVLLTKEDVLNSVYNTAFTTARSVLRKLDTELELEYYDAIDADSVKRAVTDNGIARYMASTAYVHVSVNNAAAFPLCSGFDEESPDVKQLVCAIKDALLKNKVLTNKVEILTVHRAKQEEEMLSDFTIVILEDDAPILHVDVNKDRVEWQDVIDQLNNGNYTVKYDKTQ